MHKSMLPVAFRSRTPFCATHQAREWRRSMHVRTRINSTPAQALTDVEVDALYQKLDQACQRLKKAEPVERLGLSKAVLDGYEELKSSGVATKYSSSDNDFTRRRSVTVGELRQMGIKNPEQLAQGSTRNDAAFLLAVVGSTSVLAVAASFLPGDWGFFTSYLVGAVALVVLAVGSTAPGLLSVAINSFNTVFPDYRDRVARHEAAHFLMGYLLGVPPTGFSLNLGAEHTEFAEARLQRWLFQRQALESGEVDVLAVTAVAGIAAEGMAFEEVMGQTADLMDLQRILDGSGSKMSPAQQQSITRWAVWQAASLLRRHRKEHTAVMEAMQRGATVAEVVRAIEGVE